MRIICPHCGSKAVITSRETLTETVANLYCRCKDVQSCGATFVFTLGFKQTLNPPINSIGDLAAAVLRAQENEGPNPSDGYKGAAKIVGVR